MTTNEPIAVPSEDGDICVYHARTKRAGKPVVHQRICDKKSDGKCKWEGEACKKVTTRKEVGADEPQKKRAPIAVPKEDSDICVYHARTKRAGQPVVHERICDKASDGKCEWSVRMKGMLPVGDFLCLQKDEEEITEDAKPPKKQNPKKKFKKGGPIAVPEDGSDECVYAEGTSRAGEPVVHERICGKRSEGKCEWSLRTKGMLPVGDFLCLQVQEDKASTSTELKFKATRTYLKGSKDKSKEEDPNGPIAVPKEGSDICVYADRTSRAGQPVTHERICDKKSDGKCNWFIRFKGMLPDPDADMECLQTEEEAAPEEKKEGHSGWSTDRADFDPEGGIAVVDPAPHGVTEYRTSSGKVVTADHKEQPGCLYAKGTARAGQPVVHEAICNKKSKGKCEWSIRIWGMLPIGDFVCLSKEHL